MPSTPILLTATEVADLLNVSLPTVLRWVRLGRFLAPLRFGGAPRWEREVLLKWLKARQAAASTKEASDEK